MTTPKPAPLHGVRVLEVGGMGPGPFAGMTLADMGAEVVRIDRPGGLGVFPGLPTQDVLNRGKRSVCLDLKQPAAVEALLAMAAQADILIEGHRPGVAERLGIGPADCQARNPALVYGRMTGWGQDGPLSQRAGHDISYIALTGALHAIGDADGPPQIPLNVVGDFGGGGTYLVMGVLAALWEAGRTGSGRIVDAAIVDGAAHLMSGTHAMLNTGTWRDERGVNMLDGGAPYYAIYETSDAGHMAVGAIEPKFYRLLLAGLGLHEVDTSQQDDRSTWPRTRQQIATAFGEHTRAHWTEVFESTDACVAPVMSLREAAKHPHLRARGTVVEHDGVVQAAPAPRFSGTPAVVGAAPVPMGADTRTVLAEWGIADDLITSVTDDGKIS
ncbi:CaiB/BaiF CoA-transferase family protein [Mycobacterium sp. AT1]|uniref:CaiB/BaiF CoA transferase family protein n=1 Tax=Mycobacterium sp. AT1 TaxID=1961706 RepID=UPI0009ACFDBF|nr:CaiB/BaiF CoA-transferase family protein [Mycobacterium sp. AT1]OPX12403.1 carnitine dehydratase [Mycobacterium sp. AT1]